jgi:F-type H+-transporting ATPase subunit a
MFAGEILRDDGGDAGWMAGADPVLFSGLLVGLVQALVFMLLTAVFTLLICQHHEETPAGVHA